MSPYSNALGRHCEQSEAIQACGLSLRLRLDCFAVARNDETAAIQFAASAPPR
jgi:hypothetical protein